MPAESDAPMSTSPTEEDQSLLKTLVARLQGEALHVALIGNDTVAVDGQGRRLVQRLRQDAGLEVVVLFDAQDESLIGRVNQRLASLSLDQARQVGSAPQPLQVWVLQVQTDAHSRQVQMLARMIREFPAVNLRLIVLVTPALAQPLLEGSLGECFSSWRVPGRATEVVDEVAPPPEPEAQALAPMPPPGPQGRFSRLNQIRARLRTLRHDPPAPKTVAAIAITLLFASLLVRCG